MEINISELQEKLVNKLKPSGWAVKLKGFLLSSDFYDIIAYLVEQSKANKKFTPPLKYLFRAFEECPYSNLKIVFVGMDPYPQVGIADGISFSCSITGKEQPSLRNIFNTLERVYESSEEYTRDVDLKRWSNQGILMLNAALTCEVSKSGSHIGIWNPFTTYLLDILNTDNSGLVFVFFGKDAQKYESLIGDNHFKIKVAHPASAAYNGGKWEDNMMFKTIDTIMWANYKTKITW